MENINLPELKDIIEKSIQVKKDICENEPLLNIILEVSSVCIHALKRGNKLLFAGNGGSAADSQHLAAEFVSRFNFDRPGLSAIALTTDTSMLTAIGNDYGFEHIFKRQLEANSKPGDVFFGITTSGNSPNILEAMNTAKRLEITTVGLAGEGGKIQDICDYCINIPSSATPRIQESHIMIGHIICEIVENEMFGQD